MKPQEPLTAEERALAEQLARLGSHGEPSPALDARILAAAHAEISRPSATPKPRWPVAFGLAASALLAVGVAWQLRPVDQAPMISEAPVAAKMPAEQAATDIPETADSSPALAQRQEPDAAAETAPSAPSVLHESSPAAPAKPLPSSPKAETRQAPAKPRRTDSVSPSPSAASRSASAPVSAPRQLQSAPPPAPPAPVAESAEAETVSLPVPPPAPAPASQARAAFASEPASEREVSGYVTRSENDNYRTRNAAADATAQRARRQEQRAVADEGQALDRVTVSGSRLQRTDLQVPVHDDARLAPDEWLERIRLRRDLGDGTSAAASLRLYVQEHPFRKVPEDLRPLLAE